MKKKVLLIILDGFSSNYLQKELCPNLYDISREQYFSKLEPMFAFQGVGAAIYSGALPNTTGIFTEFTLQRNKSVIEPRHLRSFLRITDVIPNERLCFDIRYVLFKIFRKERLGISNVIPSYLLGRFHPKLTKEFTEENCLENIPTIFDILRTNGMSYELQKPATRSENTAFSILINRIKKNKMPDLTVFHPCSLDLIGHKFGPHSSHIKRALKRIDKQMHEIFRSAESCSEKLIIIIVSDHGMSPVNHNVNLLNTLDKLPLSLGKDYLVFLDSTMARLWFFSEVAKKLISEVLSTLECGQILRKYDLQKLGIDKIGEEYGDLIFALKEGYTIFPDFFRKYRPPKGMHGYAFPAYDAPILIIFVPGLSVGFKRKGVIRHVDIMPTILELLDLTVPRTCEGLSLLC